MVRSLRLSQKNHVTIRDSCSWFFSDSHKGVNVQRYLVFHSCEQTSRLGMSKFNNNLLLINKAKRRFSMKQNRTNSKQEPIYCLLQKYLCI